MPPYPMMPFAVDAFLKLREEASAKFAELRARLSRRRVAKAVNVDTGTQDDGRPIQMPQQPVRRAA